MGGKQGGERDAHVPCVRKHTLSRVSQCALAVGKLGWCVRSHPHDAASVGDPLATLVGVLLVRHGEVEDEIDEKEDVDLGWLERCVLAGVWWWAGG